MTLFCFLLFLILSYLLCAPFFLNPSLFHLLAHSLKSLANLRYVSKKCSKTVRFICVAWRQRFPKNGVKWYVPFRSTIDTIHSAEIGSNPN